MVRKSFYLWESEIRGIPPMLQSLMIHVEFPAGVDVRNQKLPFFLATEEHLARNCRGEYFFMWQVEPTVIFGRNQNLEAEVNVAFCKEKGIATYRRKSGGGCVYADRNNIMFSHITSSDAVATTFSRFTGEVAAMLRGMGIVDAATTGRNDIMIGDRKVSGYAFYHIGCRDGSRAIVHGTMLYDADPDTMGRVLTPSRAKLMSKGVHSVPSRITTLRRCGLGMSCDDFIAHAMQSMGGSGSYTLTAADIESVTAIMQTYLQDDFLRRGGLCRLPRHTGRRIEGVGEVAVWLGTGSDGLIDRCRISGDFFGSRASLDELCRALVGVVPEREALTAALSRYSVGDAIEGISADTLADLIIETTIS